MGKIKYYLGVRKGAKMTEILTGRNVYETPTVDVSPISRADVITTSGEVEPPRLPDYTGDEWDPFRL